MPDRLMVGHIPLEDGILVRAQVRQHFGKLSASPKIMNKEQNIL